MYESVPQVIIACNLWGEFLPGFFEEDSYVFDLLLLFNLGHTHP